MAAAFAKNYAIKEDPNANGNAVCRVGKEAIHLNSWIGGTCL